VLHLLCLLTVNCLISAPQSLAEVPTHHPEWIEGPWEVASPSGIDEISFEIETSFSGPTGREQFDWQTINIRVYHRQGGKETWGYFATKDKASPQSYSMQDDHSFELFDGEHLRIHFIDVGELQPFDLDITFSPTSHQWSGNWSHAHQISPVVLKRPEPDSGLKPSVFIADWWATPVSPTWLPAACTSGSRPMACSPRGLIEQFLGLIQERGRSITTGATANFCVCTLSLRPGFFWKDPVAVASRLTTAALCLRIGRYSRAHGRKSLAVG